MATKLADLVRMTTPTTGGGAITLGSAVSGFRTFAAAGIADGQRVSYGIVDGANREVGWGIYTASGTTLTRNVLSSTNDNAAISLSGSAQVFITPSAEDIGPIYQGYVYADGTSARLPPGWSSLRNSAGIYTVTHGLAHPTVDYSVMAMAMGASGLKVERAPIAANSFVVVCTNNAGTATDVAFSFLMKP